MSLKELYDQCYDSIKVLKEAHPPTKEFNDIFKQDMFTKNNKVAFQHVVHYMFSILEPELTTEKITAWPLTDPQQEDKFRNEVVAFVDYINAKYDHANIPNLMAFQLVSSGGFKYVLFMWKLVMFVTHEDLKQTNKRVVNLAKKSSTLKAKVQILERFKILNAKPVKDLKKDDFVVLDSVKQLVRTENELDLPHLIKGLTTLLQNESLEMTTFIVDQLKELTEFLTDLEENSKQKLTVFHNQLVKLDQRWLSVSLRHNKLVELAENFPSGVGEQSIDKAPEEDSTE